MIKIERILIPTDFSPTSLAAIRYGLSMARDHGATVIVCHAIAMLTDHAWEDYSYIGSSWFSHTQPSPIDEILHNKRQELQRFLEDMIEPQLLRGVRVVPEVRIGGVVEEIVQTARELLCDLIIMTSRERSSLDSLFSGSLTQQVVRWAFCPVLSIQPWAWVRTERERIPVKHMQSAGPDLTSHYDQTG